jgi:hypothetical protein
MSIAIARQFMNRPTPTSNNLFFRGKRLYVKNINYTLQIDGSCSYIFVFAVSIQTLGEAHTFMRHFTNSRDYGETTGWEYDSQYLELTISTETTTRYLMENCRKFAKITDGFNGQAQQNNITPWST